MALATHQSEDLDFICKLLTLYEPDDDGDPSIFFNQRLVLRDERRKKEQKHGPAHLAVILIDR